MSERDRDAEGRPKNSRPRDSLGRPLPRGAEGTYVEEELPSDPLALLKIGRDHFNAGRFFQAHEAWETAWHPSPGEERDFWQGITQVAVGFTHLQRDNPTGAVTLLIKGATKLERYPSPYKTVDTAGLARAAHAAASAVEQHRPIKFPTV